MAAAVQKERSDWHHEGGCEAGNCTPKDSPNDFWLYSGISWIPQRVESSLLTDMKTTLQAKAVLRWPITIWFTSLFPSFKRGKILDGQMQHHRRGVRTQITKTKRQSRARGGFVKDDSGAYAVFTEQGSSASQMTVAKMMDVIARFWLWRTSSWCSICLHPSKNWGRCQIAQNSKSECPDGWIRLPRHKWPKSSCGTSRTNFFWTPIRRIVVGKTIRGSSVGTWMGKSTKLGMSVSSTKTRIILNGIRVDDEKSMERSRIWLPCGRDRWKMWMLVNPHHFLTMCIWDVLNVNAKRMKSLLKSIRRWLNHVFAGVAEKLTGCEKPHAKTVAWSYDMEGHTKKCVAIFCELANRKTERNYQKSQVFAWMIIISRKRNFESVGEFFKSMLTNCLDMLVPGTTWTTWHLVVSEEVCKISYKNGLRHASNEKQCWYFLCSSHEWRSSILSWGKHGTALQIGFVPRLRLRWRPGGLEINLGASLLYLRKPNICRHQLDVQETNVSIPQFNRVWNHFVGCWIAHGWIPCSSTIGTL